MTRPPSPLARRSRHLGPWARVAPASRRGRSGGGSAAGIRCPDDEDGSALAVVAPFARCSLGSLQLLGTFLHVADEAADVRPFVRRIVDPLGAPSCGAVARIVATARAHSGFAWTLDGVFASLVGARGERLQTRSVAGLAAEWLEAGTRLEGLDLVAFVWRIARDPNVAIRPLETKICRSTPPARLLSRAQRAALLGPLAGP